MVWGLHIFRSPQAQTSVEKKLERLQEFLSGPQPPPSDAVAAAKGLCTEIAGDFKDLKNSLEKEKGSVSSLIDKVNMLEEQVAMMGAEKAVLEESLAAATQEACAAREALREREAELAAAEDQVVQLQRHGPHGAEFHHRASHLPGMAPLAGVLDGNYVRCRSLLLSEPFAAEREAAVEAMDRETERDRQPAMDPLELCVSAEALDPAGGCGLPSLEYLRRELQRLRDSAPDFFQAIGGAKLHEELTRILEAYQGPHRDEDAFLKEVVQEYVVGVIRRLYESSQQATCDMQQNLEREAHLLDEIRALSEKLSKEWLVDRGEQETARNIKVESLMHFFLGKLQAVQSGRHEQVLEQSEAEFSRKNAEALDRYRGHAAQHSAHAEQQLQRVARLHAKREEKERLFRGSRAVANWARLACGGRIVEEAAAVKAHLDLVRSLMDNTRENAVLKDHARLELEHASLLADEVGREQERLAQQHKDLVAHHEQCQALLSDVEAFVHSGYAGLSAKANADAEAMARDLPRDAMKVAALNEAQEAEIDRQRCLKQAVMREALDQQTHCEKQLRVMEMKRSKGREDVFKKLQAEWEEANRDAEVLHDDLQNLCQQKSRWQGVFQRYRDEAQQARRPGNDGTDEFQGKAWVGGFLFSERESSRFLLPQQMIMYGASSLPADDQASVAQSFEFVQPCDVAAARARPVPTIVSLGGDGSEAELEAELGDISAEAAEREAVEEGAKQPGQERVKPQDAGAEAPAREAADEAAEELGREEVEPQGAGTRAAAREAADKAVEEDFGREEAAEGAGAAGAAEEVEEVRAEEAEDVGAAADGDDRGREVAIHCLR